jgi:mannose-1-phosphate guanylyltransferase
MFSSQNVYAIILAGDEDTRLASLTRALSVAAVPKQYAFIAGEGSLLQQTVGFYASMLSPERIVVVAATKWEELARAQLRKWRGTSVLARPRSRGQALDVMLGLAEIAACDPQATIIVAPAGAYVPKANALLAALAGAEAALATVPVILAGVPMNGTILGDRLVVPGSRRTGRVLSIRRLVEPVPSEHVQRFKALGALWDTSVFLSRAATLWRLVTRQMPGKDATTTPHDSPVSTARTPVTLTAGRSIAAKPVRACWQGLESLGVIAVHGSGWSAWTSSEQVVDSLRDPHELEQLLSRIYQHQHGIDRVQLRRQFRYEAMQPSTPRCAVLAGR